jgi:hypothetical protein
MRWIMKCLNVNVGGPANGRYIINDFILFSVIYKADEHKNKSRILLRVRTLIDPELTCFPTHSFADSTGIF